MLFFLMFENFINTNQIICKIGFLDVKHITYGR